VEAGQAYLQATSQYSLKFTRATRGLGWLEPTTTLCIVIVMLT